MEIPYHLLTDDALTGLIEEFVTREGTDYGPGSYTLEEKTIQVRRQLEKGLAVIVYNEKDGSCSIVAVDRYAKANG
ncbi:MAG: YheU family protein [Candidatus Methylomirabilis sp.]|nr:YheU family protein [Deltaproteobacteria bacterium]